MPCLGMQCNGNVTEGGSAVSSICVACRMGNVIPFSLHLTPCNSQALSAMQHLPWHAILSLCSFHASVVASGALVEILHIVSYALGESTHSASPLELCQPANNSFH
jgi:hypothetical protein